MLTVCFGGTQCCGQTGAGVSGNADPYVCPKELPTCVDYVLNKHYGFCANTATGVILDPCTAFHCLSVTFPLPFLDLALHFHCLSLFWGGETAVSTAAVSSGRGEEGRRRRGWGGGGGGQRKSHGRSAALLSVGVLVWSLPLCQLQSRCFGLVEATVFRQQQ